MSTITEERRAQTRFHPGEHIQEELDELSISPEALAEQLGIPSEELLALIAGRKALSAEFALRIGHFFGTTAQYWLNLQTSYDLEKAELEHGAEIENLPTLQAA